MASQSQQACRGKRINKSAATVAAKQPSHAARITPNVATRLSKSASQVAPRTALNAEQTPSLVAPRATRIATRSNLNAESTPSPMEPRATRVATRSNLNAEPTPSPMAPRTTTQATPTTTQLPIEEPTLDQQPTSHSSEASSTPAELKRKRGKTTAKGLIEMIATNGNKKVEIIFDREHWVPNTEYSNKKFTTSIGIEVRNRAPVCFRGWNKIPGDIKRDLREGLTVHFEVEIDHPKIVYFVNDRMRSAYTQFKWKLHDHYQKCGTPAQGRATLPPPDLWGTRPTEDWHWLCDQLYTDPKYIDKCKKNSANRKEQQSTHRGGAMPFIQHALRTAKEGKPLSFIENWGAMYQDSNHNWVSDAARDRFNKLKNKREEIKEKRILEAPEGTSPESIEVTARDEIPIMAEECGRKGKRVRGLGSFPCMEIPISYSSVPVNSDMTDMRENINKLSSTVETMQSENAQLMALLVSVLKKFPKQYSEADDIYSDLLPDGNEDDVDNYVQRSEDDHVNNYAENLEDENYNEEEEL